VLHKLVTCYGRAAIVGVSLKKKRDTVLLRFFSHPFFYSSVQRISRSFDDLFRDQRIRPILSDAIPFLSVIGMILFAVSSRSPFRFSCTVSFHANRASVFTIYLRCDDACAQCLRAINKLQKLRKIRENPFSYVRVEGNASNVSIDRSC